MLIRIDTRHVVALKGDWTPRRKAARAALIDTLMPEDFTTALARHGLKRPQPVQSAKMPCNRISKF